MKILKNLPTANSILLSFFVLAILPFTAAAQVTSVGTPASSNQSNTIANFTVPAGNKRLLLVTASDGASTNITGVTFNGMAMIERHEVTDGSIAVDAIYTLSLGDAAVSVTGNIVFTSTGPSNTARFISASAFTKVDQTTPLSDIKSGFANTSSSSLTVAGSPGDLVYDIFDSWKSTSAGSQVAGAGQTIVRSSGGLDFGVGAGYGYYSVGRKAGGASVTTSWDAAGHEAQIHIAANIRQDNFVLPVKLVSFNATSKNADIKLNWVTTGESYLDRMEIERSINGTDFSFVAGCLTAAKGYKDVNAARFFSEDKNLFYRLKIVDEQGNFSYSEVVKVTLNKQASFVTGIRPLFAEGKIAVSIHAQQQGAVTLRLSGVSGQLIKTTQVNVNNGNSTQYMDGLHALTPGLYVLQVVYGRQVVAQTIRK